MAKKKRHNPEKRDFKGRSYKKAKGRGSARISALRLRDFVRDVQETMAICEHEGSTEYMYENIEAAFEKHKIPSLVAVDDPNGDDAIGIMYKGDKLIPTIENRETGKFDDIDD